MKQRMRITIDLDTINERKEVNALALALRDYIEGGGDIVVFLATEIAPDQETKLSVLEDKG